MSGSHAIPSTSQTPPPLPLSPLTAPNSGSTNEGVNTTAQTILTSGQGVSHAPPDSLSNRVVTHTGRSPGIEKEEKKERIEKEHGHTSRPLNEKEEKITIKLPLGMSEELWSELASLKASSEEEVWLKNLKLAVSISSKNRILKEKQLNYNIKNNDPFTTIYGFIKDVQSSFAVKAFMSIAALKECLCDFTKRHINESGKALDLAKEYTNIIDKFVEFLDNESSEMAVNYQLEVCLNRILNRKLLFVEAEAHVEQDKAEIAYKLVGWVDIDPNHLQVTREFIEDKTAETHNGGKIVLIFNITHIINKKTFKFVYKPRKSFIDAAVIELFNAINIKFPSMPQLFIYKILNYKDREVSYWEYVDGKKSPNEKISVSHFKNIAMFKRILEITKAIGVHEDIEMNDTNWKWKPLDKGDTPKVNTGDIVVPIDLEAVGTLEEQKLDPAIESLVSEFNTHLYEHPFRKNPGTMPLVGLQSGADSFSPKIYNGITKMINTLEGKGYELTINKYQFGFLLILDLINGDVPYFCDMNKTLYCGLTSNGTIIGRLNSNVKKNKKIPIPSTVEIEI